MTNHLAISFFDDGFPKLALYGPEFVDRGVFGLGNGGFARLALYDAKEMERVVLRVSSTGDPSLVLRDNSDDIVFEAPVKAVK